MTDLVKRLRLAANPDCWWAADEIERLRAREQMLVNIWCNGVTSMLGDYRGEPVPAADDPQSMVQLEALIKQLRARVTELERDAARWRYFKDRISVPYAMQSFLSHMNWHPDTFALGIDEAIDAAKEGK